MKATQTQSIRGSYKGINSTVGDLLVNRLLPGPLTSAIGPFVFLDHLYPTIQKPKTPAAPTGKFAHPHRGIATFTYVFSGALEHFDSHGGHGIVSAGGAQWMKAGNGVIHDEHNAPDFQATGGLLHAMQFWINLPSKNKAEAPGYLALQSEAIPEIKLPNDAGKLRVVIGEYAANTSPVETYSRQFLYHVELAAGASFSLSLSPDDEAAAIIPENALSFNSIKAEKSELIVIDTTQGPIEITNSGAQKADVVIFGGEPYTEPIVAEGPFVMNSRLEISKAYSDFFAGKYGRIEY